LPSIQEHKGGFSFLKEFSKHLRQLSSLSKQVAHFNWQGLQNKPSELLREFEVSK
jgi:hypothetical protein